MSNVDPRTVAGFGDEWQRFTQADLPTEEREALFQRYFAIFPWERLSSGTRGFDMGCGSGRWARLVAPRVGELHCVDASTAALEVARTNLGGFGNCRFHHASVDELPFADDSMDFGYSLGVLHHVPDTVDGLHHCVRKLRRGAPFLVYLYYALDNRPLWFRSVWRASDLVRRLVSRLPHGPRYAASQLLAGGVYFPLARLALGLERMGLDVQRMPLASYRASSFYTMRTDALDRFGTQLEQRFTREQIEQMMISAGLTDIHFSDDVPYWCAVGIKA